jgi:hypothetical protein
VPHKDRYVALSSRATRPYAMDRAGATENVVCGSLAPAFWGRQVEHDVPHMIREAGLRIVTDQFVRQGVLPSRVLAARKR